MRQRDPALRLTGAEHRAAVLGRPVEHSLSPLIHNAGYAAAGLAGWRYTAVECAEAELPGLVAGLGPEWVGLSLTMPLKRAGLAVAADVAPLAAAIGAANTLIRRRDGGWLADNTDAGGIADVLRAAGVPGAPSVTVLGAGGTARAALAAAAELNAPAVTVVARRPAAVDELRGAADALGVPLVAASWADAAAHADADAVVSTVPKGVADALAGAIAWRPESVLLDSLYDPWPTPLAAAAAAGGCRVASGLDLLLAQAVGQFERFTGAPAPIVAMRDALRAARG